MPPRWGRRRSRHSAPATINDDVAPDELTPAMARELLDAAADDGRVLGQDPASGHDIVAKAGRYGPYVTEVLPEADEAPAKGRGKAVRPSRARHPCSRTWTSRPSTSTPRSGCCRCRGWSARPEDGEEITAQNGRYGPYLKKGTDSRTLETEDQLFDITLERGARDLRPAQAARPRRRQAAAAELGTDPVSGKPVVVKDGRFGPYVTDGETNATLRKDDDPEQITPERGYELLADKRARGPVKKTARKVAKKTTTRKTAAKKTTAEGAKKAAPKAAGTA